MLYYPLSSQIRTILAFSIVFFSSSLMLSVLTHSERKLVRNMLKTFDFWYILINLIIFNISSIMLYYVGGFAVIAFTINNINWMFIVFFSNSCIMLSKTIRQIAVGTLFIGYGFWLFYFYLLHFTGLEQSNEIIIIYPYLNLAYLARVSCTNLLIFLFKVLYLSRIESRVVFSNIFLNIEKIHEDQKEVYGIINQEEQS